MKCFAYFSIVSLVTTPATQAGNPVTQSVKKVVDKGVEQAVSTDPRLNKMVTVNATGVPLSELLKSLTTQGLALRAAPSCASLKVQIRFRNRPLTELINAIADLLPGRWEAMQGGAGYLLLMDESAVARRRRWWDLITKERDTALAAQKNSVLIQLREKAYRPKEGDPAPLEASDPGLAATHAAEQDMFNELPASVQQQIANRLNDSAFYATGQIGFGTDDTEGTYALAFSDLPQSVQAAFVARLRTRMMVDPSASIGAARGVATFTNGGIVVMAGLDLPGTPSPGVLFKCAQRLSSNVFSCLMDQAPLADEVKKSSGKAPESWKRLAAYQESRVWPNDLRGINPIRGNPFSRAAILHRVAEQAGFDFVADYYSRGGRPMTAAERKMNLRMTDVEALNTAAHQFDCSWKRTAQGVVLVRNNRWYRDDLLEVDAAQLRRWLTTRQSHRKLLTPEPGTTVAMDKQVGLQMDWEAEVIAALSPWQIQNGLQNYCPSEDSFQQLPEFNPPRVTRESSQGAVTSLDLRNTFPLRSDSAMLMRQRRTAKFYSSLSSQQRAQLLSGRLPLASLSPAQQEDIAFLAPVEFARSQGQRNGPLVGIAPKRNVAGLEPGTPILVAITLTDSGR